MIPLPVAIVTRQLDIKCFLEQHGTRPPVASINRTSLDIWTSDNGFNIDEINTNCVRLWEPYPDKSTVLERYAGYDQIWVKASYGRTGCRKHLIKSLTGMVGEGCDFRHIDADHVVAQVRLASFKEAWVNIFPVRKPWNMFFGGVETRSDFKLKSSDFKEGIYYVTGFECLKILLNNIEELVQTAKEALIVDNDVVKAIRLEMDALKGL